MYIKVDVNLLIDYFYGHYMPERSAPDLPTPVVRSLKKLGSDIRDARLRRRIPTATMAQRAAISRMTLNKIEKGYFGVALGHYAMVLFVLGLQGRLADLADLGADATGRALESEQLPQRIRLSSKPSRRKDI